MLSGSNSGWQPTWPMSSPSTSSISRHGPCLTLADIHHLVLAAQPGAQVSQHRFECIDRHGHDDQVELGEQGIHAGDGVLVRHPGLRIAAAQRVPTLRDQDGQCSAKAAIAEDANFQVRGRLQCRAGIRRP